MIMKIIFKGKVVTRDQIQKALEEFRRQYPDTNSYEGWLDNVAYKYAVRYAGLLYPPKHILSQVTGIPTPYFNGGVETNHVFRELGFEVIDKWQPNPTRAWLPTDIKSKAPDPNVHQG